MPKTLVEPQLFSDIQILITQSKQQAIVAVNTSLTMMYWQIGQRLNQELLSGERAEYGKQIVANLAKQLTQEFGKGWSARNLAYMMQLNEQFPDQEILHSLCAKLSWSHFRLLITLKDPLAREFYMNMCAIEAWSVRTLNDPYQQYAI